MINAAMTVLVQHGLHGMPRKSASVMMDNEIESYAHVMIE